MGRLVRAALLGAAVCALGSGASSAASAPSHRRPAGGACPRYEQHPNELSWPCTRFVPAGARVRRECRQTADAVRYPVPCPTLLPQGMKAVGGRPGCRLRIVGAGGGPTCGGAGSWRGWIVGASERLVGNVLWEDLGLQGAPRVIADPTRAIDGPGMLAGSRVQPRGEVRVAGRLMRWYFVPPATNRYSGFEDHLVLVWNADGHTYAYGFQVLEGLATARAADLELARHLVVVRPRPAR